MNTPRHPATLWPAFALVGLLTATLLCASCSALLPENVAADQNVPRTQVRTVAGASLATEAGLSDGVWLEVPRSGAAGSVGGYLSEVDGQRARLILLLPGASTYYAGGMVAKVRDYHDQFAAKLRNTGLRTWTLAVHECGTPYGQEDLTDVLSALDWLAGGGAAALGVERVYVVGYSSGATLAILASERRAVSAVVALDGLTGAGQFGRYWGAYRLVADMFPRNTGLCQLGTTLDVYGLPGAPGWQQLDAVSAAANLRSPLLVLHGEQDFVYLVDNARALDAAYAALRATGAVLPPAEFAYLPTGDHFNPIEREEVVDRVLAFLERF
jgi:pimeloyl-ACP methyl ester carboxylesterase